MVDEESDTLRGLQTARVPRAVAFRRVIAMVVVTVVAVFLAVSIGFVVAAIGVAIMGVEADADICHCWVLRGVDIYAGRGR